MFRSSIEEGVNLAEVGVAVYTDIVSNIRTRVESLYITEELTNFVAKIKKVDMGLEQPQIDSLNVIREIHSDVKEAILLCKLAVMDLKSNCKAVLRILQLESNKENFNSAIRKFLNLSKSLKPKIDNALEKLIVVISRSSEGCFLFLFPTGCSRKSTLETIIDSFVFNSVFWITL